MLDVGGEGGIRTPDTVARMPHFECGAFNHSATSPGQVITTAYSYIGANGLATLIGLGPKLDPTAYASVPFVKVATTSAADVFADLVIFA